MKSVNLWSYAKLTNAKTRKASERLPFWEPVFAALPPLVYWGLLCWAFTATNGQKKCQLCGVSMGYIELPCLIINRHSQIVGDVHWRYWGIWWHTHPTQLVEWNLKPRSIQNLGHGMISHAHNEAASYPFFLFAFSVHLRIYMWHLEDVTMRPKLMPWHRTR